MNSATVTANPTTTPQQSPSSGSALRSTRDWQLYVLLVLLTFGAWQVSRLGIFTAGDDVGYWIGVAGAMCMLLLFIYPLRKYVRFMHRWGQVKWWLVVHMTLGIAGPLLILVHSTFHIGSMNAAVALYSMIVVALSGIIGRFIYVRVHRGLDGERTTLRELQTRAGFDHSEARSKLQFAPAVEARLMAFEQRELQAPPTWLTYLRQVAVLPWQQWRTYRACVSELREPLIAIARHRRWSAEELAKHKRQARKLVRRYLTGIVRVAQFKAYERVFALWHIAHVPFVYILVVSAIVHVIAVHIY